MKIILVYGGQSPEHEVSIMSAYAILQAIFYSYYEVTPVYIQKNGRFKIGDVLHEAPTEMDSLRLLQQAEVEPTSLYQPEALVFPCLHGPNGEDGTFQGFLETLNMPYVGCGVLASACGMDKIVTKNLMLQAGIPQVPFVPVIQDIWKENPRAIFERIEGALLYPMYVKPANMGSSVGITRVEDRESLQKALGHAFQFDRRVIVEQGIDAREIEVALLGNHEVRTSLPGEVKKPVDFYDYQTKYENQDVELVIPAVLAPETQEKVLQYAKQAYQILAATGLSRCDFFVTNSGEVFFNEINTMPGFTPKSMYPALWQERGLSYGDLIEELIQLGLNRFRQKQERQQSLTK